MPLITARGLAFDRVYALVQRDTRRGHQWLLLSGIAGAR